MIARSIEQDTMYNSNDDAIVSLQWCSSALDALE